MNWSRSLRISALGHAGAIGVAILSSLIFSGPTRPYIPSLKVDVVDLPEILKAEARNPQASALKKEVSDILSRVEKESQRIRVQQNQKNPDQMVLREKQTKALAKKNLSVLQRMKALEKLKAAPDTETSQEPEVLKGNQLSKGSSTTGEAKETETQEYLDVLRERLNQNWDLPPWLSRRKDLAARVVIRIDTEGRLAGTSFVRSSGSTQYDDAVKKTIESSSPFPPPPQELQNSLLNVGVEVGFPL